MHTGQLFTPEGTSPLGRSRTEVLDMLHAADGPLDVREVAQRMGLHPNTARFHLEALVEAGLAVRETEGREVPGRPRIGYRAAADGPTGQRRYRLLSEMLTSLITATMAEPGKAAEEAGREWGAYLTEQPPPYQRPTAAEAVAKLAAIMDELDFAPRTEDGPESGQYRLCLWQCPFREVAQHHQDVICALHLGLMRGALARMRAPVTADRLEPFVEPGLCVARLAGRLCGRRGLSVDPSDPDTGAHHVPPPATRHVHGRASHETADSGNALNWLPSSWCDQDRSRYSWGQ